MSPEDRCAQNDITTGVLISVQSRSCNPADHRRHTVLGYPIPLCLLLLNEQSKEALDGPSNHSSPAAKLNHQAQAAKVSGFLFLAAFKFFKTETEKESIIY